MLDRLDQIIETMGDDSENTEQPSTTPDTQSTEESSTEETHDDSTSVEQNNQEQSTEDTSEDTSATEQPNETNQTITDSPKQEGKNSRNKNKYTHEEQVAYAFNKLNSKFSRTKHDLANALKEIEALKKAQASIPAPESKQLGPEAFASQADYFKYIANQSIIEQLQKAAEQKRASEEKTIAMKESQDRYTNRAMQIYNTPEAIEEYNTVVGKAINEEGLGDAIAEDPVITDFINTSNYSPRLVYHFAAIPEDFERIKAIKDPTDKRFALNMLQQKILSVFAKQSSNNAHKPPVNSNPNPNSSVPIIGKAGTGGSSAAGTTEESLDDVMANIRNPRY